MSETITTISMFFAVFTNQLGSNSYQRREAANAALARLTPYSLCHIHLTATSRDTEAAARSRKLSVAWRRDNADWLAARTRPTEGDKLPWIWLGEYVGGSVNHWYQSVPRHVRDGKTYERWRHATRLWIADHYRAGWTWKRIVSRLDQMAQAERDWVRVHQRGAE